MAVQKVDIEEWLVAKISELTETPADEVDIEEPFMNYGVGSQDAMGISGDLEDWLGTRLSPTLVYDYPTIELLSKHLSEGKE